MSITRIADKCGFDELIKFHIFFKRQTGINPSTWRKQNRADS